MTTADLKNVLDARFGGKLLAGKHKENGEACALELLSAARSLPWSDDPETVRCWDLSNLNDMPVSDSVRTEHLLPVLAAYDGSMDWPADRQKEVVRKLVIGLVQKVIAALPTNAPEVSALCKNCDSLQSALSAADAAAAWGADADAADAVAAWSEANFAAAAAWGAANAADAAAWSAAADAGWNAADAALEKVFAAACGVFLDATGLKLAVRP